MPKRAMTTSYQNETKVSEGDDTELEREREV